MHRALALALVCLAAAHAALAQTTVILHIRVVLTDADQKATPVARHVLLISDNPATSSPRRVVTGVDGTVDVRLRPGNYTVESDEPFALLGRSYQWTETLDVRTGGDTVLELTSGNAEIGTTTLTTSTAAAAASVDPLEQLARWRDSVAAVWTPTSHASAFLVDRRGFLLTNQRSIEDATDVAVQFTPDLKVSGRIVASDVGRDLAVVRVDPTVVASFEPVSLGCGQAVEPVAVGDEIVALGVSLRGQLDMLFGDVLRSGSTEMVFQSRLPPGSAGGPAFTDAGTIAGVTSPWTEKDGTRARETRVVPIAGACDVLQTAEQNAAAAPPPSATHLPAEPSRPFPSAALQQLAERRSGGVSPYQLSSSDFEVSFITPLMVYAAQRKDQWTTSKDTRVAPSGPTPFHAPTDFGIWSEYFAEYPPVLAIRVTPKMAESFWSTLARGAAMTQGMSIPAMKRVKTGFSRVRAFCGDAEIEPIHPFVIESPVGPNATALEGLYVFAPDAFGPHCASVKLTLFSTKEPDRGDTRTVTATLVNQIWQDFEAFRQQ